MLGLSACDSGTQNGNGGTAAIRDRIRVVGSSTVFPYSVAVAEEFANKTGRPAPVVESTGTGGGMKIFCDGVGESFPDIAGASRAMKPSEWTRCQENGVTSVSEALIGYDGLTVSVSRKAEFPWALTESQIFLALASQVPDPDTGETLVDNPYTVWSEIDDSLPETEIRVFGPPPTSGTRDAFVELAMHDGCQALPFYQAEKAEMGEAFEDYMDRTCSRMRQDGPFIEAGENDNLIVQRLNADPTALGIFGYSFLYENQDILKPVIVNGVEPTLETIGDGSYDIARPLFFYSKNAHRGVIPGLEEFIAEYVSMEALGPDGYLVERGLTPLSDAERARARSAVLDGSPVARFTQ
ncbi:MAG: substrate-binding domain-containing protein [Alphaproteobacteria bacterium]